MSKRFSEMWKQHYGYGKCKRCGETNLDYLTWHHRDKRTKRAKPQKLTSKVDPVGKWVGKYDRVQWLRAKREIDKCDLLCIWCHRRVHNMHLKKKDLIAEQNSLWWAHFKRLQEEKEYVPIRSYNIWSKIETLSFLPRKRVREMYG